MPRRCSARRHRPPHQHRTPLHLRRWAALPRQRHTPVCRRNRPRRHTPLPRRRRHRPLHQRQRHRPPRQRRCRMPRHRHRHQHPARRSVPPAPPSLRRWKQLALHPDRADVRRRQRQPARRRPRQAVQPPRRQQHSQRRPLPPQSLRNRLRLRTRRPPRRLVLRRGKTCRQPPVVARLSWKRRSAWRRQSLRRSRSRPRRRPDSKRLKTTCHPG